MFYNYVGCKKTDGLYNTIHLSTLINIIIPLNIYSLNYILINAFNSLKVDINN